MQLPPLSEKLGTLGTVLSAMGCASCFPVLGALGSALGMGFLAQFEGLFINTLLPAFAAIALAAALASWWSHRQHLRGALTSAGPIMVLATLYLFWSDSWSSYLFYAALSLMSAVAVWNLVSPPRRTCRAAFKSKEP